MQGLPYLIKELRCLFVLLQAMVVLASTGSTQVVAVMLVVSITTAS